MRKHIDKIIGIPLFVAAIVILIYGLVTGDLSCS